MSSSLLLFPNLSLGYGQPTIVSLILPLSFPDYTCPLKNILHSTWCIIALPTFTVLSTFLTNKGFFSLSILNSFSLAKAVFMNKPVALLSNNTFTTTPSWLSNFSNPTFIHTSLSSHSVRRTSLTLSVVLEKFVLLPNFSGCNTLYRLLEAS